MGLYPTLQTPVRFLRARGGVVGAAAGDLEVTGDAGGGVAGRESLGERGGDVGVDLVVAGLGRGRRRREDEHVLAARLAELDVADGLLERSPPHLLVELGELAGDGHLAQRSTRAEQ